MTYAWKITAFVAFATIATAVTSGLTAAYLVRVTEPAAAIAVSRVTGPSAAAEPVTEPRRPPIVRVTRTSPPTAPERPVALAPVPADAAPAPAATAAEPSTTTDSTREQGREPVNAAPSPAASVTTSPDCATGGDRAWRIVKPGAVGTLVGAGAGALGGAIADGGNGAGKGALWGSLAGAAIGSAWGAYTTHRECGTVFGDAITR